MVQMKISRYRPLKALPAHLSLDTLALKEPSSDFTPIFVVLILNGKRLGSQWHI